MLEYNCPKCGEEMESPDCLLGQAETCPKCGISVTVLPKVNQTFVARMDARVQEVLDGYHDTENDFLETQRYIREYCGDLVGTACEFDYLGRAALFKHAAKRAIREKEFDVAWRFLHEQKKYYRLSIDHWNQNYPDSRRDDFDLDALVHEDMANILRLEKKHTEALVHILYWVIAQSSGRKGFGKKSHEQKLRAYFNRCKFGTVSLNEAVDFALSDIPVPDFMAARNKVQEWLQREELGG